MVNEVHVTDRILDYVLGCLDVEDDLQVNEHLAGCPACQAELREYEQVMGLLPLAASEYAPPPYVKEQLMRQIRPAAASRLPAAAPAWQRKFRNVFGKALPAWSLASLVLVVALVASNLMLWQRLDRMETLQANTLRTIVLQGTESAPGATGLLVISLDGEHGTLVVDQLAPLDESHQYQLWLTRDGQRVSGGVFSVDENGYGAKWIHAPDPLASYTGFGVTVEPEGGSSGPTGDRVLGGSL